MSIYYSPHFVGCLSSDKILSESRQVSPIRKVPEAMSVGVSWGHYLSRAQIAARAAALEISMLLTSSFKWPGTFIESITQSNHDTPNLAALAPENLSQTSYNERYKDGCLKPTSPSLCLCRPSSPQACLCVSSPLSSNQFWPLWARAGDSSHAAAARVSPGPRPEQTRVSQRENVGAATPSAQCPQWSLSDQYLSPHS